MTTRRKRYQVSLFLMPGSEPWIGVEANGEELLRLPAQCSLLELLECLEKPRSRPKRIDGEVMVRVPLRDVLTVGGVRELRRRPAR